MGTLWSALRDRTVARLLVAASFSALAGGVFLGALPLAVVSEGGGPFQVGLVAAALNAWYVLSVPFGALIERYGVGRSLRAVEILRLVALLGIAAHAFFRGTPSIIVMAAGALLYGLFNCLTSSATAALPALVVDQDRYDEVFSLLHTINRIAGLVFGPSIGALLLVTQRWLPFVLAAVALAVAYFAFLPFFTDSRTRAAPAPSTETGWFREATAGIRHLVTDPFLRAVVITLVGIGIAAELVEVTVAPYVEAGSGVDWWEQLLGYLRSAAGIASIAAALGAAALARTFSRTRVMSVVALGGALCPAVLAIGAHWTSVLAALMIAAVAESIWVPLSQSEIARRTPAHLMVRTRAAITFVIWGTLPLTSLLGGVLAQTFGIRQILVVASTAALISCLLGIWRIHRSTSS